MKHIGLVVIAAGLGAAAAWAQSNVYSRNAVGFVKVEVPPAGSFALVGLNFRQVGGGTQTVAEVFGTNSLRKSNVSLLADRVSFYDAQAQGYVSVYQKTDDQFYLVGGSTPTNFTVTSGEGFWIAPPQGATTNYAIYLMGEVVSSNTTDKVMEPGFNLLGYAFASAFNLAEKTNWVTEGATGNNISLLADRVYTWDPAGGYTGYYLRGDGTWALVGTTESLTNVPVAVGQAVWYNARSPFTPTFDRPYNWW